MAFCLSSCTVNLTLPGSSSDVGEQSAVGDGSDNSGIDAAARDRIVCHGFRREVNEMASSLSRDSSTQGFIDAWSELTFDAADLGLRASSGSEVQAELANVSTPLAELTDSLRETNGQSTAEEVEYRLAISSATAACGFSIGFDD